MTDSGSGTSNPVIEVPDEVFEALANEHRRRLLSALLERNPQQDSLVRVPLDGSEDEKAASSYQIEMYHTHLPILETMGFIEWDRSEHTVIKGPNFSTIKPVLEQLGGDG